ncbi:MAG: hypothetical protein NZ552_00905 [Planctomycetes bacterium]|nr:hypothetical protein [Planctomycetota bacterium]
MIVIGGWRRLLASGALALAAVALLALGWRLDWGLAWIAWLPAFVLLLPALALAQRRVIERRGAQLLITDGWLFRRCQAWPLSGAELEILPAGGAWVVILHVAGRELVLASWIRRSTAERLAAALGDVPRRPPRAQSRDR